MWRYGTYIVTQTVEPKILSSGVMYTAAIVYILYFKHNHLLLDY